jgi:hypothetical protein
LLCDEVVGDYVLEIYESRLNYVSEREVYLKDEEIKKRDEEIIRIKEKKDEEIKKKDEIKKRDEEIKKIKKEKEEEKKEKEKKDEENKEMKRGIMLLENNEFFHTLLNYWENAGDSKNLKSIRKAWPVKLLTKCFDFLSTIAIKGILSILAYYSVTSLFFFFFKFINNFADDKSDFRTDEIFNFIENILQREGIFNNSLL